MQSINLKAKVGADGKLSVQLPSEMSGRELEVVIVYKVIESNKMEDLHDAADHFYGCLSDDPILVTDKTHTA